MKNEYGDSIYFGKDNRVRVYVKDTKKTISYPKYLMEKEIGRKLLPNEEVHHKDKNPLNNDLSNLELRFHGEHQAEHSRKYTDKMAICGWCGKEFLWSGLQQQRFYSDRRIGRHKSKLPFCSRACSGNYGKSIQIASNSSMRKLTSEQAKYIRDHYIPYDKTYGGRALSRLFGVDKSVVELIAHGETYKDAL